MKLLRELRTLVILLLTHLTRIKHFLKPLFRIPFEIVCKLLELLPDQSIYSGNSFTVVFPEYYESIEQPGVQVPYLEKLRWAKANDPALYNDLARLAVTSNYLYIFNEDYISPYFCANFSITKELGDIASLSFYANNFFNNMGQVFSTKTGNYSSVSSYIPSFYYGLTLRLKF